MILSPLVFPGLTFPGKARAYPSIALHGTLIKGELLALLANIGLDEKTL